MSYEEGDPCPNCGAEGKFGATCKSYGALYFDDDGNVIDYQENHVGETLVIQCMECDEVLIDKLN